MPEDSNSNGEKTPQPPPRPNSLDGFTNSPKPPGPPTPSPNHDLSPSQPPSPSTPFNSGGIDKPMVTSLPATPQHMPAQQPMVPQSMPDQGATPFVAQKKSRKKLWLFLIVLLVLLLLGAGYVFAFYLPNTPNNVYKSSLENTGLAVDKLIDYSKTQQNTHYKSYAIDGSLNVKSPDFSFDTSINGALGEKNGQVRFTGDFMGTNVKADIRYVTKKSNSSPDAYVQISGVKKTLNSVGMGALAKYDGKWISIDHTLLDTYKSSLQSMANNYGDTDVSAKTAPTSAQIQDAAAKVQTVNKQYIFTIDSSKAVLTNKQFIGKDTVGNRTLYHYKVGYSKEHLEAYVTALGQALDSSQLNDWSKKANNGKSLSEVIDIKSSVDEIKKYDANYTFDLWADKETKLVSKLAFTDTKNKSNVFTISQNYTGGYEYPFAFGFTSKDNSGNPASGTFGVTVNSRTNKVSMTLKGESKDSSGTTSVDGKLDITPGKDDVVVTVPTGATPIMDILKSMGLGSATYPASPIPLPSPVPTPSPSSKPNQSCPDPRLQLYCAQTNAGTHV